MAIEDSKKIAGDYLGKTLEQIENACDCKIYVVGWNFHVAVVHSFSVDGIWQIRRLVSVT